MPDVSDRELKIADPRESARAMLIAHLPVVMIAAAIGVGLFYLQHQFEGSRWVRHAAWDPECSALEGSSHLVLPQPFRWLTANIGIHHVHHVSSRIPFYDRTETPPYGPWVELIDHY